MTPEPYICPLDLNTNLKIYLFRDVQNVELIRNNIVNGTWNCAVIKPSLILDVFQLAVAANRAVLSAKSQTLVTKTVFAEILFNLSLSKNISQSLSKFGIEKDNNILVCFLVSESDDSEEVISQIKGVRCPISDLPKFTNMKDLKTAYKLNSIKSDVDLLDIIVSRMATKSFVSF